MRSKRIQKLFLRRLVSINMMILLPLLLWKRPIKDWIIVYFVNAASNGIIDNILSRLNKVRYPIRLFPNFFDIHVLFDFLLYPTFTVFYNQVTYKNKLFPIIYKLILLTLPPFLIEIWAQHNTKLIKYQKGWRWYHTFVSIITKSLFTRAFIGLIRKIDEKQVDNVKD